MSGIFIIGFNYLTDFLAANFKLLKPDLKKKRTNNRSQSEEGFTKRKTVLSVFLLK